MEMKVDSSYIKAQRERRAWSQEHLAEVTGLGLRTIQRIEKTGAASYESARSLAAVFEVDVAELRDEHDEHDERADAVPRISIPLRPVLGVLAALVTGGALLVATTSFADQVLMDVSVAVELAARRRARAGRRKVVVDDGALVPERQRPAARRFAVLDRAARARGRPHPARGQHLRAARRRGCRRRANRG